MQTRSHAANPSLADLKGLWRRSLIVRPDGSRDTTTWVRWLQGARRYIDLRQSASMLPRAGSLAELSREDCLLLAGQEGFAGELTMRGGSFEWRRDIDFQPSCGVPDAGSLTYEGDALIERGRDVPYLEHWHRDSRAASPSLALELRCEAATSIRALLVRVGECFMFARGRAQPLPPARSLRELIAQSSLEAARAYLDCEISYGEVRPGSPWRIVRSSLPWRVGDELGPSIEPRSVELRERTAHGTPLVRRWEILARED